MEYMYEWKWFDAVYPDVLAAYGLHPYFQGRKLRCIVPDGHEVLKNEVLFGLAAPEMITKIFEGCSPF
jgi:hypothetical protein